jgi:hypothetical protein
MSNTDIREWCRENGIDVNDRGPVKTSAREAYFEANPESESDSDYYEAGPELQAELPALTTEGETAPTVKVTWQDKLRQKKEKLPRSKKERPARPRGRRKSLEDIGSFAWLGLASVADQIGGGPVARCLAFQAPVAGAILEDSLKGTMADRVLQPFARMAQGGGDLGALIMPPILIAAIQQKPELYPKMQPMLIAALRRYFKIAGPKLKQMAEEEEALRQELGGVDLEGLIKAMFEGTDITPEMMGTQ